METLQQTKPPVQSRGEEILEEMEHPVQKTGELHLRERNIPVELRLTDLFVRRNSYTTIETTSDSRSTSRGLDHLSHGNRFNHWKLFFRRTSTRTS